MLVVVAVLLFITVNRQGLLRLHRLRAEQERLEREIARLEAQTTELMVERAHLETDLSYVERLAREKYRMVQRGEKVFRVMPSDPPAKKNGKTPPPP